jgi:FeS assembly protein IscX
MRWNNIQEIAEALEEGHSDQELDNVRLRKIHNWVIQLLDFEDDPGKFNERILEAIQEEWEKIRSIRE